MESSDLGLLQYAWRVALVFALLLAAAYAVRRWAGSAGPGRLARGRVRIVEAVPVGPQRLLLLVEVEGRRLLIGATPQSFTLLAQLDPTATDAPREERCS
ncbi:MAG: flagellar biosynthetic protein FliO [Limnochordales bacterium]|nr:flagellar biosynthetic protein FliO [Bacillota bacterium]